MFRSNQTDSSHIPTEDSTLIKKNAKSCQATAAVTKKSVTENILEKLFLVLVTMLLEKEQKCFLVFSLNFEYFLLMNLETLYHFQTFCFGNRYGALNK